MEDLPETYQLESIEQMRTIADPLRLRIIEQLTHQAMTVTQLAELLDEVPSKLHYHVRELEKAGLLKLVETREKGGILEKYYRAVAKNINAPGTLFRGMPPDEAIATLNKVLQPLFQEAIQAARHMLRTQAWDDPDLVMHISPEHYWMTAAEFEQVSTQIAGLLKPYQARRGIEHEREQTVLLVAYTTPPTAGQKEGPRTPTPETLSTPPAPPAAPLPAKPPRREIFVTAGVIHLNRQDLAQHLAAGEVLDMHVFGSCTFADDVTPDLIDRAISSFRLWGKINASPDVREVLKRKGGDAGKKNL